MKVVKVAIFRLAEIRDSKVHDHLENKYWYKHDLIDITKDREFRDFVKANVPEDVEQVFVDPR